MARPFQEPSVPTALAPALLRFARERGVVLGELTARFDLPDEAAEADDVQMAPATLKALFEAVEDACGEPWIGLRLAALPPLSGKYAPLELAVRASRTVKDALDCLARFALLIHPQLHAECAAGPDGITWVQRESPSRPQPGGIGRHAEDYALAFALARCREACKEDALFATSVTFVHARPRDTTPLQRFFGTPALVFGAEANSFTLRPDAGRLPLTMGDDRLLATALDLAAGALTRQAPETRTSSLVASRLPDMLPARPTLETVARALAMSERTLQRRLEAEGTTFLDVQDDVREARARALLRERDLPLAEVAERIGFSDLATFSRAFKRWTGQPPGMFRRKWTG